MTDAPWNGIDSLPQTFDPVDGPPRMLECMVPFYEMFIPLMCEGDPAKLKAALEALEQRNTCLVEDIINPREGVSRVEAMRCLTARVRKSALPPPGLDGDITRLRDRLTCNAPMFQVVRRVLDRRPRRQRGLGVREALVSRSAPRRSARI